MNLMAIKVEPLPALWAFFYGEAMIVLPLPALWVFFNREAMKLLYRRKITTEEQPRSGDIILT
jgi:hypothetical protein